MGPLIKQWVFFRFSSDGGALETIAVTASFEQEDKRWVGTCLELGTSAYGDTLDEAGQDLADAVLLELREMRRLGYERDLLQMRGVRIALQPLPAAPHEESDWLSLAGTR